MIGAGPLRRAVYRAHFVFAALFGALSLLLVSGAGIAWVAVTRDRRTQGRFARIFSAAVRTLLGWRIEVENQAGLDLDHPVVFMPRHQSNLDVVTLGKIYPYRTVVLGKKELRKIPLFGWFFAATGNIFIDRQDQQRAIESIREASDRVLAEGISVWAFPEGTRNPSRQVGKFKKGAFHLAITAQIGIVPIVLGPIDSLLDVDRWMARPGRLRVRVLEEIPSAGLTPEQVDLLVERVWRAMDEGQKALLEGALPPIG